MWRNIKIVKLLIAQKKIQEKGKMLKLWTGMEPTWLHLRCFQFCVWRNAARFYCVTNDVFQYIVIILQTAFVIIVINHLLPTYLHSCSHNSM